MIKKTRCGIVFPCLAAGFVTGAKAECDGKRCNPANKTNALAYLKWLRGAFTTHQNLAREGYSHRHPSVIT